MLYKLATWWTTLSVWLRASWRNQDEKPIHLLIWISPVAICQWFCSLLRGRIGKRILCIPRPTTCRCKYPKVEIVRYLNVSFQQVGIPYAGTKVDEEKSSWLGSILEMMRTTSMKKNCDDPESFKINWRNCVFKRRNLSMYAYNPYVSSV